MYASGRGDEAVLQEIRMLLIRQRRRRTWQRSIGCTDKIIWVQERGNCGTTWNYLRSCSLDGKLILCWSKDFSHSGIWRVVIVFTKCRHWPAHWSHRTQSAPHILHSYVRYTHPCYRVCVIRFLLFVFSLSRLFLRWRFETNHFRLLSNPQPFSSLVLTLLCHQPLETLRNWQSLFKCLGRTFCYCSTLG